MKYFLFASRFLTFPVFDWDRTTKKGTTEGKLEVEGETAKRKKGAGRLTMNGSRGQRATKESRKMATIQSQVCTKVKKTRIKQVGNKALVKSRKKAELLKKQTGPK